MPKFFIRPKLIYLLRIYRRLTINELAEKANIDRSTVRRIEQGKISKPGVRVLNSIAKTLKVEPHNLLTDKEDERWL